MENQGFIVVQQMAEQLGKPGRVVGDERPVGLLHEAHGIGLLNAPVAHGKVFQCLHHGRLNRQSMHRGPLHDTRVRSALDNTPKITHTGQPKGFKLGNIGGLQTTQVIGTKQFAPLHRAPLRANIATQVTKVGSTLQRQGTRG